MRRLITLAAAVALAVTACGDDDDDVATDTTEAAAATSAAATETTEAAPDTTAPATTGAPEAAPGSTAPGAGYVPGADPEADAVAAVWTTVFDSSLGFDAKAALIVDAEALRPTIEAYTPAGEAVGGITVVPIGITVDGDQATVTYDVLFAGQSPGYPPQTGTAVRTGDEWHVSREEFCGFMASARNNCPA